MISFFLSLVSFMRFFFLFVLCSLSSHHLPLPLPSNRPNHQRCIYLTCFLISSVFLLFANICNCRIVLEIRYSIIYFLCCSVNGIIYFHQAGQPAAIFRCFLALFALLYASATRNFLESLHPLVFMVRSLRHCTATCIRRRNS